MLVSLVLVAKTVETSKLSGVPEQVVAVPPSFGNEQLCHESTRIFVTLRFVFIRVIRGLITSSSIEERLRTYACRLGV